MTATVLSPEQAMRAIQLNWLATNIATKKGLNIRIPTALIGDTGCGKTDSVNNFYRDVLKAGRDDAKEWIFRLGHRLPEDIGGMPTIEDGRLVHKMLTELPFDCNDFGVIFLDEFDRAPIENQNAALPIVYGDSFHGHRISPNAYVVLAMNGTADNYTTPLSQAAATRVCSIYVSRNANDGGDSYRNWAIKNGIPQIAIAFNQYHHSEIKSTMEFEEISVTVPRTVDMAAMISEAKKLCDEKGLMKTNDIYYACIAGVIGQVSATKFLALEEIINSIDVPALLNNPDGYKMIPTENWIYGIDMAISYIATLEKSLHRNMADKLIRYVVRQPNFEHRRIAADRIIEKYPTVALGDGWATIMGG